MKKRILMIGPEGSGKKDLVRLIEGNRQLRFVSSVVYYEETILIPGSYLRGAGMKKHIIAMQQNAYCILMVLHSHREYRVYPPNFAKVFRVPVIGVIVHHREAESWAVMDCRKELTEAKVDSICELNLDSVQHCHEFLHKKNAIKEGHQ